VVWGAIWPRNIAEPGHLWAGKYFTQGSRTYSGGVDVAPSCWNHSSSKSSISSNWARGCVSYLCRDQPLFLPLYHSHFKKSAGPQWWRMRQQTCYFWRMEWFLINFLRIINGAVEKLLFINIPVNMKMCFVNHKHPFWLFLYLSSRRCLQLPTVAQDKHPCPTCKRNRLSLPPTA